MAVQVLDYDSEEQIVSPEQTPQDAKTISRMNLALNLTITSHGRMTVLMSFMDTAGAR